MRTTRTLKKADAEITFRIVFRLEAAITWTSVVAMLLGVVTYFLYGMDTTLTPLAAPTVTNPIL